MPNQARFPRGFGRRKPGGWARLDSSHRLAEGLVAAYLMAEGGGKVHDATTNHNDVTLAVNAAWTRGGFGGPGITFDGSSYASAADATSLNFGTGDFSIAFWFKTTTTAGPTFISKEQQTGVFQGWDISLDGGSPEHVTFYVGGTGGTGARITGTSTPADGYWHLVVGTRSGVNGVLYVDGKSDGTTGSFESSSTSFATSMVLGAGDTVPDGPLIGQMDYVLLWNRLLSAKEVWSLFVEPFAMWRQAAPSRAFILAQTAATLPSPLIALQAVKRASYY